VRRPTRLVDYGAAREGAGSVLLLFLCNLTVWSHARSLSLTLSRSRSLAHTACKLTFAVHT